MKVQNIQKFTFQNAQYRVEGADGSILLNIDYRGNTFHIKSEGAVVSEELITEAERVAHDLLSRKHGKNFAERVS